MSQARPSMQELIGRRRRAGFVGRSDERAAFRANLDLPPEDERHRFLFHVHGNAGVGKTFLVRELEQLARERGALTAYVDEGAGSVPEAMAAIGHQLAKQGRRLKRLEEMLAAYRDRRHEAEAEVATLEPAPRARPRSPRLRYGSAWRASGRWSPGPARSWEPWTRASSPREPRV
ncbi:ATP-binding protein [Streptomyces diastatochromogenes]|nr:ATP-binding protein [Streptomyces diastatochromogenes]